MDITTDSVCLFGLKIWCGQAQLASTLEKDFTTIVQRGE